MNRQIRLTGEVGVSTTVTKDEPATQQTHWVSASDRKWDGLPILTSEGWTSRVRTNVRLCRLFTALYGLPM